MKRKTPRIASEAYQERICSDCWRGDIGICVALLKQLYGIQQGVVGHMDITIHGCLNGSMSQKQLKNLGRHTPFVGSGRVGMPKSVHTKSLDTSFITQLVQVGIIGYSNLTG